MCVSTCPSVEILRAAAARMSCTTDTSTSSSENSPCTPTADSNRSSENDTTTGGTDGVGAQDDATASVVNRRKSYPREKKLMVLKYYYENGCNKYQTCKRFGIPKPCLHRWIRGEKEIQSCKKGTKRVEGGRRPFWPDMEVKLVEEFKELRQKGLKVKHYWFKTRACQLMREMHPDDDFRLSQGWFDRFKARNDLSYRRATNVAQQKPSDHEIKIRSFHQEIRQVAASGDKEAGQLGKFSLSTIANVDQTPLPFTFNKGQGYDQKGAKTVWHRGAQSSLNKRQCTVQLTIFADGEPRIKPLLIFRGKGLRISQAERKEHDGRVVVKFKENAWCDESIMQYWVSNMWRRPLAPEAQKPKLLIADVHKAQKTPTIANKLKRECKTEVVLVPPGCTSLIQPLDASFNGEFKAVIDKLQTEHMHDHLEQYVNNSLTASAWRILLTKWVGAAWAQVSQKKEMVQRAFKKCGISVPIDGSEDVAIKIRGIEGYSVRNSDSESEDLFEIDSSDNDSDGESMLWTSFVPTDCHAVAILC